MGDRNFELRSASNSTGKPIANIDDGLYKLTELQAREDKLVKALKPLFIGFLFTLTIGTIWFAVLLFSDPIWFGWGSYALSETAFSRILFVFVKAATVVTAVGILICVTGIIVTEKAMKSKGIGD